jgi:ribosomal protein S18 acetylase RimI-like enzyme
MMLRNPREGANGQPSENVFQALDERTGEILGSCVITGERKPALYPNRPHQVRLEFDGGQEALDPLLGAALARARAMCIAEKEPARIYVRCAPDDAELLDLLKPYGFKDNDGIVRMRRNLPARNPFRTPTGCVVVKDALEDPQERKYFLERYNELYGTDYDGQWLREFTDAPGFQRFLTVAPTGMAGEVVLWRADGYGQIGFLQTARRWRHMGVAKYMLGLACDAISEMGPRVARADVRAKIPYILSTMEAAGFYQETLITRYPGIDV